MMNDYGLADALAADAARTAKLEEYRQAIRRQLAETMDAVKPELAGVMEEVTNPVLRDAILGLTIMNAGTSFGLSLSIQNLSGIVFNLVPEEKRAKAVQAYSEMANIVSEETTRAMEAFDV